jgi:BolA protein
LTDDKKHLSRASRIEGLLKAQFAPAELSLADESALHAGHAGARPGGETHYRLRLVSEAFEGLNRVARQRLVYQTLREEFETGLHALSLDLKTPSEADSAA